MKIYTFTVKMSGSGDTPEEAWGEAFANFDPGFMVGNYPDEYIIEEID